jgi:hypothetical protein
MFDLLLQEFDFVGGEIEEAMDAVVQFGFSLGQGAREAGVLVPFFAQVGFPFVGGPRVFQGVGRELEALFQGFTELI